MTLFPAIVGHCDTNGCRYTYRATYVVRNSRLEWSAAATSPEQEPMALEGVSSLLIQTSVPIEDVIDAQVREAIERLRHEAECSSRPT